MSYTVVTGPSCPPVHLDEAKAWLGVSHSADDSLIAGLIESSAHFIESQADRSIVLTTWDLVLDCLPYVCSGEFELRRCPVQSVVHVKYTDPDSDVQTIDEDDYYVDTVSEPARVRPNLYWPSQKYGLLNGASVRFRAGWLTEFRCSTTGGLTSYGRNLTNGDVVRLSNSGGELPTALYLNTDYYVVEADGADFALSETVGGSAIAIDDEGSGLHFIGVLPSYIKTYLLMLVAEGYRNREATVTGTIISETPQGIALQRASRWTY